MNLSDLPQSVIDKLDVLGLEPLTRFQFAVSVEGMVPGARFIAGFREATGLHSVIDVREVKEAGYRGVHSFPRKVPPQEVKLTRGFTFSRYLWHWHLAVVKWMRGMPDYRRNLSIYQLHRLHSFAGDLPFEVWRWDFTNAWPSEWIGPDLNSMAEEIAVEAVVLRHAGMSAAQGIFSGKVGEVAGAMT